jgi:predicted dehydrogenase
VHKTYTDLLADPEIDAIYNPLPNSLHAEWTIRALRAGKHLLCEKPFASNAQEATQMASAADETGKVLSEGFAYRYHPLTARIKQTLQSGELGRLKRIEARFCFLLPSPGNIRFRYDLAGGALMDAGCYPISLIRYLMDEEPTVIDAKAKLLKPEIDSRMEANLEFSQDVKARIICDMNSPRLFDSVLKVLGADGEMTVINPYHPHWFHWMTLRTSKNIWRGRIQGDNVYTLQLRAFASAIQSGTPLNTTANDAVKTMQVIDAIYAKAGLKLRGA